MDIIKSIEEKQKRPSAIGFNIGDTVKVYFKIVEGKTERIQVYEGVVIAKNGGGTREAFTVRKDSYGIGVERVFPMHSPRISKVEIVRPGRVRRAKLYYLRDAVGKAKRIKTLVGGNISAAISERNARVNAIVAEQEAALKAKNEANEGEAKK